MNDSGHPANIYGFQVSRIEGRLESLEQYRNQVLLIVNVASHCGFTPQYRELQVLHDSYRARGFSVLGFPCNQFGNQEPGTNEEIAEFCAVKYEITFPLFQKIEVNGAHSHPLFDYLKQSQPGLMGIEPIKWNFTKFLVARNGQPVARFAPVTNPSKLPPSIETQLDLS